LHWVAELIAPSIGHALQEDLFIDHTLLVSTLRLLTAFHFGTG